MLILCVTFLGILSKDTADHGDFKKWRQMAHELNTQNHKPIPHGLVPWGNGVAGGIDPPEPVGGLECKRTKCKELTPTWNSGAPFMIVGLSRDKETIRPSVWHRMVELCSSGQVSTVDIVVGDADKSSGSKTDAQSAHNRSLAASAQQAFLDACNATFIVQDPAVTKIPSRLVRIATLREQQRSRLVDEVRKGRLPKPSSVFVIDLDAAALPSASAFHSARKRVEAGGHWDIICAAGYGNVTEDPEQHPYYYDTLATIFTNGSWMWGHRSRQLLLAEELLCNDCDRVYEMRSCFGGLAAYRYEGVWDGGAGGRKGRNGGRKGVRIDRNDRIDESGAECGYDWEGWDDEGLANYTITRWCDSGGNRKKAFQSQIYDDVMRSHIYDSLKGNGIQKSEMPHNWISRQHPGSMVKQDCEFERKDAGKAKVHLRRNWCEHVAFHECLRKARRAGHDGDDVSELRVGILPRLGVEADYTASESAVEITGQYSN